MRHSSIMNFFAEGGFVTGNQGTLTKIILSICQLILQISNKQPLLTAGLLTLSAIDTLDWMIAMGAAPRIVGCLVASIFQVLEEP